MNIKKSFLVALATVTAAVSVSAVAVSAVPMGTTYVDVPFTVVEGEAKTVTNDVFGKKVTVAIPADSLAAGTQYFFQASPVADAALEAAFDAAVKADYSDIFEIAVRDDNGVVTALENVTVTVAAEKGYDTVYKVDGENFVAVNAIVGENGITFTVPNGTKVVLAKSIDEPSVQPSTPSQPSVQPSTPSQPSTPGTPAQTGDNGAATATVFAVMGVVALGTALAATKMKKSAK